jgi:hypothetical protein
MSTMIAIGVFVEKSGAGVLPTGRGRSIGVWLYFH